MGIDWFIKGGNEKHTFESVEKIVRDFVSIPGAVSDDPFPPNIIMVLLPGEASHPTWRMFPELTKAIARPNLNRWIEVDNYGHRKTCVTVKFADEFTQSIAAGLAKCLARVFGAELEEPS